MSKYKFKIGDKVRIVSSPKYYDQFNIPTDCIYTIRGLSENLGLKVYVAFKPIICDTFYLFERDLQLATKPFIHSSLRS